MEERVNWEKVQEFTEEGLAVQVFRLPLRYPRFGIEVGSSYQDHGGAKTGRRISVRIEGKGTLTIVPTKRDVLDKLIQQAEAWILSQAQEVENKNRPEPRPQQPPRPQQQPGQPHRSNQPVLGLKAMKKRDKAAYEAKKAAAEGKVPPTS